MDFIYKFMLIIPLEQFQIISITSITLFRFDFSFTRLILIIFISIFLNYFLFSFKYEVVQFASYFHYVVTIAVNQNV
jgi:hypothetical protein